MAMHRLPAGTEGPRWRVLAAVWAASAVLAFALSAGIQLIWHPGNPTLVFITPAFWLAIQWAAWLYLKDRPAHPRIYTEGEPEPDDSPTLRMETVEANPPAAWDGAGDRIARSDLDRPAARHALKETRMTKPTPTPRNPAEAVLPANRFAPFTVEQVEAAALALQTTRWNFTLIRKMPPNQAVAQFNSMNRYLREQVCKEAHAALTAAGAPVWPTVDPEVPAGARDDAAEVDDFWNRKMGVMIDWFNPPDEDAACESIVLDAIERAYKFAESQPCTCVEADVAADYYGPDSACSRCQVLGRVRDVAVPR